MTFKEFRNARRVSMTDEEYFSDKYKHYASNSSLGLLNKEQGGSPSKYLAGFKESTNSLEIGSIIHQLILEGDKFKYTGITYPAKGEKAIIDYMVDYGLGFNIESYKEAILATNYYGGRFSKTRFDKFNNEQNKAYFIHRCTDDDSVLCMPRSQEEKIKSCLDRVENNKLITGLLRPKGAECYFEDAVFVDVVILDDDGSEIVIPFKCKFDQFDKLENVININDLKTSSKGFEHFGDNNIMIDNSIIQSVNIDAQCSFNFWHYYRQAAVYTDVMKALFPECIINSFNFLVISTGADATDGVWSMTNEAMIKGVEEYKRLLCELAHCIKYGFKDEEPDEDLLRLFNL